MRALSFCFPQFSPSDQPIICVLLLRHRTGLRQQGLG